MKKLFIPTINRLATILLIAIMTLMMVTSCTDKLDADVVEDQLPRDLEDRPVSELPEEDLVFVTEYIPLSEDIGVIENLAYHDGTVFYTTRTEEIDEDIGRQVQKSYIHSMKINEGIITLLPEYGLPMDNPQDASEFHNIDALCVDDGNVWVAERWGFYKYDIPDGYTGEFNVWEFDIVYLENGYTVRKLNQNGAELLSINFTEVLENDYPNENVKSYRAECISVDDEGSVYVGVIFTTPAFNNSLIYVFDSSGDVSFSLDVTDKINSLDPRSTDLSYGVTDGVKNFVEHKDGSISFVEWVHGVDGISDCILRKIDVDAKSLGDLQDIPDIGLEVLSGGGIYDILIKGSDNLYSYNIGDTEPVKLLNYFESFLNSGSIDDIAVTSDGRLICSVLSKDMMSGKKNSKLTILTLSDASQITEKTVLMLATFDTRYLSHIVPYFNSMSSNYYIAVTNYSQYIIDGDRASAMLRLNNDIITGNTPDIVNMNGLSYNQFVSKGLLEDLYLYIDADPDFNRGDYIDGAFRASEIDGKLYQLYPALAIRSLVGNPDVLGHDMGWNMEEFMAVLDKHPNADRPLGWGVNRQRLLENSIFYNIGEYIDWETGNVSFDNEDFIRLIETVGRFPDVEELTVIDEDVLIATGRQLMTIVWSGVFLGNYLAKSRYGGELVFKGWPVKSRNGNTLTADIPLAMMADSEHKDGVWEFLRLLLDPQHQLSPPSLYDITMNEQMWLFEYPIHKEAFAVRAQMALEGKYLWIDGGILEFEPLTQKDIDDVLEVIDIAADNGLESRLDIDVINIISEVADDYFNSRMTAQDAARVIQSRVSILVAERT